MCSRTATVLLFITVACLPAPAQGQGFGIGGRMSMVRVDVEADTTSERFLGGHIRGKLSPKTTIEVSLDRRTDTNEEETERIRQYPLQASLLLFPVRTVIAPYILGGGGWYTTRVEILEDNKAVSSESSRKFGWHGGFGAELRLGRHAAAHADYRYTHLRFGDDDEETAEATAGAAGDSVLSGILPSYQGSMWTAGLTIYF
jgi:opacity protein-like surface antigen